MDAAKTHREKVLERAREKNPRDSVWKIVLYMTIFVVFFIVGTITRDFPLLGMCFSAMLGLVGICHEISQRRIDALLELISEGKDLSR